MMKKLAIVVLALIFLSPTLGLVTMCLVMNPAVVACLSSSGLTLGNVPGSLVVTTANGETLTLNKQQLTHAATIITVGSRIEGVTRDGVQIALIAALTESTLRQLANTGTYPESGGYPNDGNGSDHDSLGLFQMRPQSGWGSVAELMDPEYQAAAFFGGPAGSIYPSPRGLLDIPRWQSMSKGEAAQAVEVSAFPDRYNNYGPVAEMILMTLTSGTSNSSAPAPSPTGAVTETSHVVFPLPESTWVLTGDFGPRFDPITGERAFHSGTDLAAPDGTPILAAAEGVVTVAEFSGGYGGHVVIEHRIDGATVATAYAHMWKNGIHVRVGEHVVAGQHIGDVGSSGHSTGPHLHFEVRPGGTNAEAVDAAKWLNAHDAADLPEATIGAGCSTMTGGLS
jgi:murein DD-endopeptidase